MIIIYNNCSQNVRRFSLKKIEQYDYNIFYNKLVQKRNLLSLLKNNNDKNK